MVNYTWPCLKCASFHKTTPTWITPYKPSPITALYTSHF